MINHQVIKIMNKMMGCRDKEIVTFLIFITSSKIIDDVVI